MIDNNLYLMEFINEDNTHKTRYEFFSQEPFFEKQENPQIVYMGLGLENIFRKRDLFVKDTCSSTHLDSDVYSEFYFKARTFFEKKAIEKFKGTSFSKVNSYVENRDKSDLEKYFAKNWFNIFSREFWRDDKRIFESIPFFIGTSILPGSFWPLGLAASLGSIYRSNRRRLLEGNEEAMSFLFSSNSKNFLDNVSRAKVDFSNYNLGEEFSKYMGLDTNLTDFYSVNESLYDIYVKKI